MEDAETLANESGNLHHHSSESRQQHSRVSVSVHFKEQERPRRSMTLGELASASLIFHSAHAFLVPPASVPQHLILPSASWCDGRRNHVLSGSAACSMFNRLGASAVDADADAHNDSQNVDKPADMARPRSSQDPRSMMPTHTSGPHDTLGDLDALDDLLGGLRESDESASSTLSSVTSRHDIGGDSDGDIALGNLDALDDLLRRDAEMRGNAESPDSGVGDEMNAGLIDDGFGALDDLLGLEDGPRLPAPADAVAADEGDGGSGGGNPAVTIDPYSAFDVPARSDSLDDLLRQNLPSAPKPTANAHGGYSTDDDTVVPMEGGAPSSVPGLGAGLLDDLLDLDNNPPATADRSGSGGKVRSPSQLESLIDEVSAVPDVSGGEGDMGGSGDDDRVKKASPSSNDPAATAPAAIDDWLNDLLSEESSESTVTTPPGERSNAWPSGGSGDDPWDFGDGDGFDGAAGARRKSSAAGEFGNKPIRRQSPGRGRDKGGYDDVITGSNQLEGWKSNMSSTRTNVLGRSPGRPGANADSGEGGGVAGRGRTEFEGRNKGGNERNREEEGFGRGGDWGQRDGWVGGEKADHSDSWGRPPAGAERYVDPVESAQRAVTADLKALGNRGEWEDALRALVGARVRGVPVNSFMYNSAIAAVSKCGRWKEALSMKEQMKKDGVEHDVYTYCGAISACGKGGQALKALELLDEMTVVGITPDMMCYGSAVQACANEGLSEEALDVMRRMNAAGFVPDKTAYNAAITACGEQGEWEKALEILAEMRGAGLRPDQHSYRFAMQACGNGGRWERAVALLHEMEEDGSTPQISAFEAALDTLKHAGQWEKALEVIAEMDEVGVTPTEHCFSAAIAACAEVGQWLEACNAVKDMRDLRLQPTVTTYNSVLKACVRGEKYDRALTTMNDLRTSGKRPEQESWDLLIEACAVCGRWECALEVVSDMFAEEVYYDMDTIRERFYDCPVEDIRNQALSMIIMEARNSASMRRRKQSNIRAAAKRKAGYKAPKKSSSKESDRTESGVRSFADLNIE